jgi:hypothetical protein
MSKTHLDAVEEQNLPRWSGFWGQRFIGIVVGVMNDMLIDGASIALMSQYSTAPDQQPLDALDMLGKDCNRPHYEGELYSHLRSRILGKWDFWTGSPKQGLIDELEAAGITATIKVPGDFVVEPNPVGYWSRFWVQFPFGTHPVTGGGAVVGTAVVGVDRVGPAGIASETGERYLRLIQSICKTYKPLRFVVWDFEFEYASGKFVRLMGKKRVNDPDYIYQDP